MCNPRVTVDVVLHFSPPTLQASLHKVQLLIGDAVRGRVRWGLDGWSALGERLVYGCPLTTGNQSLWRICFPWFAEEGRELIRKTWQNCYITGSVTDEDFTWGKKICMRWETTCVRLLSTCCPCRCFHWAVGYPELVRMRSAAGLLQEKHCSAWWWQTPAQTAACPPEDTWRGQSRSFCSCESTQNTIKTIFVASAWRSLSGHFSLKKQNKTGEVTIPVSVEELQVAPWVFSLLLSFHWSALCFCEDIYSQNKKATSKFI